MKKSIFLFFAAILCAIGAKAFDQSAVDLYFDNSTSKWTECYVYIGHNRDKGWVSCYTMSRVSGTQYLWKLPANFNGGNKWGGATGWVVCKEKWWDSQEEDIYKFVYHGSNNVTNLTTTAWVNSKIYKADGTTTVDHYGQKPTVYKLTTSTKSNYTVTINTVEGGTLTVKDYDDNAVATGASKIHLTVLKFSAAPASGYVLDGVEINDGNNITTIAAADLATNTHTLTSAVTITPVWRATTSTVTVTATATNGTVTGGGVVEEGTSVTLTATPADGYKFVNWTVGGAEVSTANPYTFTAEEDVTVVANFEELPKTTVYFVNNKNWSAVCAYAWEGSKGENQSWPGANITANKLAEKIGEFDVYSYTVEEGSHAKVIFNNNNNGSQTENFVWTDGKYYYMGAAENYAGGTKEEVAVLVTPDPLATEVYLAGDMTNKDNWDVNKKEFRKATADATNASVTVTLEAQTYKFKLVIDGAWKGNTGTMQRGGDAVHEGGWSFDKDGYDDNCQIVADIAGDYTFTWDLNTKKLTVAYPPLPKYTVTATAENGSVTGAGEYEQGSEATLVATPDAGYAFKNWTKGGEEVSTEATYTFTVTADVELVANFVPEETHEVTVSYLCNDTPIPGKAETKLAVGVTTPSTISAPAITNYEFDSWTLGSGVQAVDATLDPIQITTLASGEYTLAANYTKIELTYTVEVPAGTEKCFIRGAFDGWDMFHEMTKVDDTHYTITIEGATTDHKYKYACQASWDYVELKADGSGVDDRTYNANDVVAKWAEPAKCYLMGNGDWVNGVEMEYDSENGQYILLCHHISAPFKFKLGDEWSDQVENNTANGVTWTDEDADGNFDINLPEGDYNFYFKKDSKKVYIEVSNPALSRTVPVGYYATVCLSQNIIKVVGATLFEVAGKDGNKVIFDEVLTPVAGMPYIFLAEENTISFYCGIETAATPGDHKSLHGTFEDMADAELDGMYMVQNNKIVKCAATGCNIPANRAYFNGTELEALGVPPTPMPGRRRITMGAEGENTTTGVEGIIVPEGQTIKVISNGQLIIIHNGEMYNAQGQKL